MMPVPDDAPNKPHSVESGPIPEREVPSVALLAAYGVERSSSQEEAQVISLAQDYDVPMTPPSNPWAGPRRPRKHPMSNQSTIDPVALQVQSPATPTTAVDASPKGGGGVNVEGEPPANVRDSAAAKPLDVPNGTVHDAPRRSMDKQGQKCHPTLPHSRNMPIAARSRDSANDPHWSILYGGLKRRRPKRQMMGNPTMRKCQMTGGSAKVHCPEG